MLKNNALQQLAQLKNDIRASKDIAEGKIRGTQGRFGFVVLDDGREAFLPPEAMERVFPGDRVEVSIETSQGGKLEANLEKLISTELKQLVGRYTVRGKGHFVQADLPQFNRWLFVPPKGRQCNKVTVNEGDYVHAQISRHPFADGKSQVNISAIIGTDSDAKIEHRYTLAKFSLPYQWDNDCLEQAEQINQQMSTQLAGLKAERQDFTQQVFVTIDSASTLDMDDALCAEATDDGWTLQVAIADPSSLITTDTTLEKQARQRASTVYLPGGSASMLPRSLSQHAFSLMEGAERPALICSLQLGTDGQIKASQFSEAIICSQAKLSYEAVSDFLEKGTALHSCADTSSEQADKEVSDAIKQSLKHLREIAEARRRYRSEHALLMEDKPDFNYKLNEQGKITAIHKQERNIAQQLVEEAMLATNYCAGQLFEQHGGGLFSGHAGFRDERKDDARTVIGESLAELADCDIDTLAGYRQVIHSLQVDASQAENLGALKRMLRPGELTSQHQPHFGLGLSHYATVTSPIRRYHDLHNHRAIKQILRGGQTTGLPQEQLSALQQQLVSGRQACRQLEQWLCSQFMAEHYQENPEQIYAGRITMVNSQGIGIELTDNGVNGYALLRTKTCKTSLDSARFTLTAGEQQYRPEQRVKVKICGIDQARKQVNFALVDNERNEDQTTQEKSD